VYLYQTEARYFAQVPDGGEDVAADELTTLGAEGVRAGYRGLYFGAERRVLYGIAYRALTITRVLAPLIRFQCHSPEYLYKRTQSIAWSDFFSPKQTFAVFATVSNSAIRSRMPSSTNSAPTPACVRTWRRSTPMCGSTSTSTPTRPP